MMRPIGHEIIWLERVDSTNDAARRVTYAADGMVIVADTQTRGRGRRGRFWYSPMGGLWASFVLGTERSGRSLTLSAAAALCRALSELGFTAGIKWPNDVYMNGQKVAGILVESRERQGSPKQYILGIGVNIDVSAFPAELQDKAASLAKMSPSEGVPGRDELLYRICHHLEKVLAIEREEGFGPVLDYIRALSILTGSRVIVQTETGDYEGLMVDIEEEGALRLETEQGILRFYAGEVSVAPKRERT